MYFFFPEECEMEDVAPMINILISTHEIYLWVIFESTSDFSSSLLPFLHLSCGKRPTYLFSIYYFFPLFSFSSQNLLAEILLASNSKLVYTTGNLRAKAMSVSSAALTVPSTLCGIQLALLVIVECTDEWKIETLQFVNRNIASYCC